jgi:hypothetical protein
MDEKQSAANDNRASYVQLRTLEKWIEDEEQDFNIPVSVNYTYDQFDPVDDSYHSACA